MDKNEFQNTIVTLKPKLRSHAFFLSKNSDDADDLAQDVMLKALLYYPKINDFSNIQAWLFTILNNTFINKYRRSKKQNTLIDTTPNLYHINLCEDRGDISPESCYQEKELKELIENLKPIYREPFELLVAGWKYEEISEKLDVKLGTIKSRIFFARKELMKKLVDNQLITNTMNDIAKTSIKDRLIINLEKEGLLKTKAGELLGVKPQYLSMVLSSSQWNKFPESVWDILQKWVNSGLSITKYGEKNGILTERKPEKSVPKTKETVPELVTIGSKMNDFATEMVAKPEPRPTNGQMIDFMLAEKRELAAKIEAIDVLLKHYIS